ncbi:hypothetical protein Tco_0502761 [Tanacetum coccineum]
MLLVVGEGEECQVVGKVKMWISEGEDSAASNIFGRIKQLPAPVKLVILFMIGQVFTGAVGSGLVILVVSIRHGELMTLMCGVPTNCKNKSSCFLTSNDTYGLTAMSHFSVYPENS